MPFLPQKFKRSLFWIVARTCFALYRCFPLLGSLRASVAVIRRDDTFLVIRRNDGRGLSMPGGISRRGETEEQTLRREVREETGCIVTRAQFEMKFHTSAEIPTNISVFRAEVTGELKDSWEGSPEWLTVKEIERELVGSQRPVLKLMSP